MESYPDIASIVDIGESSDISSPGILSSDSGISSSGPSIPSPLHTRSYGRVAFNVPFQCDTFAFVDDYSKVNYGMRDTPQMIRKDVNDALFRTAVAAAGKVVLSKL